LEVGAWTLLLLTLAGCGGEASDGRRRAELSLAAPEWQYGEVSEYEVVRRDTVIFRRTVTVEFDEESALPLAAVTSVVRPVAARVFLTDSMTFAVRRFSLKPEWSYRLVLTDVSASEATARWSGGGVDIRKETVEGAEERRLAVPDDCFGAEMVQTVLRGLPLEPGAELRAHVLIPLEFRVEPVGITVLGTRLVSTPVGEVLCREVQLAEPRAAGARRLRLLYELAQPHRLIEVRDPDTETRTTLVAYTAARPDTAGPE
jgi:hypothetical protein